MERTLVTKMNWLYRTATATLAMALLGQSALAQDWNTAQGNNSRSGTPTLSPSTPGGTLPSIYNDPGRTFIRWWDPVQQGRNLLDNGDLGTAPTPAINWNNVGAGRSPVAFNYILNTVTNPIYTYTRTVPALSFDQPTLPAAGFSTSIYSFTFVGLSAGDELEAYLNVPLGQTDDDPDPLVSDPIFPQQYLVVEVSGVVGGPYVEIINTFSTGGAFVRLGNDGIITDRVFEVDAVGSLTITIYNTTPRSPNGGFLDFFADPGNELVYADAAMIVGAPGGPGTYIASPVVSELTQPPPIGGALQFPIRVVSSRVESSVIGGLNRTYNVAAVTSFAYNGANVFDPTLQGRKNMVWSWPFRRPHDNTTAERNRAASDRRDWVFGPNVEKPRYLQTIQSDNLNGSSTSSGFFIGGSSLLNFIGMNYLVAPATVGAPMSAVDFAPDMPDGDYTLSVWIPDADSGSTLARSAQYLVLQGGNPIDTLELNQAFMNGWTTLPGQPFAGYAHSAALPLSLRVIDQVADSNDLGRLVYADAARFTHASDLSVTSTPVQTRATVTLPGGGTALRDVLIVSMEDGRIYCIDAHGDPLTGDPPQVYWVYPSESPSSDPNSTISEDGPGLIAEMPIGFDMSSALVQNVGGNDLLFIGSQNGRVYCIDMAGRGDGTTSRRWTYPDDYSPTAAGTQIAPSTLGPITGSLSYGTGPGPTIYVPTTQGRIFALDALGNAVAKTTTVRWQFPLAAAPVTVGPITMAPTVAFGNVYFGGSSDLDPAKGAVYAVDESTGLLIWTSYNIVAGDYPLFGRSGILAIPGSMNNGGGPFAFIDAVVFVDMNGNVASLNAATGALQWETPEIGVDAVGTPAFTYQTVYNNAGLLQANVPVVIVPASNGRLVSLLADGSINAALRKQVWGFALDGDAQIASVSMGGKNLFEAHSWMYIGDSNGTFYAFNHDPSLADNNQRLFGGDQPGFEESSDNDPTSTTLNNILDPSAIVFLVPQAYEDLFQKMQDGTLTYADVTTAATTSAALRRKFEFGETLYVLAYNLPDLGGTLSNYFIEFTMSSGARGSRARPIQTRLITAGGPPVGNERFVLTALPILPTGSSGVVPGAARLRIRAVAPSQRGLRSQSIEHPFSVANPLALAFEDRTGLVIVSSVSNGSLIPDITDPLYSLYIGNGNSMTDQLDGRLEPYTSVRPSLTAPLRDSVGHGTPGVSRALVIDRSLLNLIFGNNRGLQNVRLGTGDTIWVIDFADPTGGVYKPLTDNTGVTYPGFEDYPNATPNISLDYPDVRRDRVTATKSAFGFVQNPQFTGVSLVPPLITALARSNYRLTGPTGYDTQMARVMQPTIFDLTLSVPRYQPPSSFDQFKFGYYGSHTVYVDSNRPGFDTGQREPFRTFGMGLNIAVDERVSVATPTVDLGSQPAGAGFNGGAAFGPLQPWFLTSLFSPWNASFTNGQMQMFNEFRVHNDGNVNLLNVRVAKEFDEFLFGNRNYRPLELFAPGLHELAWLDGSLHMYSNLDPRFSATSLTGLDVEGRNILQKARPGDVAATQLNVNPRSRVNPNMSNSGFNLMNTATVPPGDPKIGATSPIGAPVGDYLRNIYAFEDRLGTNRLAAIPSLGQDESFSDPGFNLKFTVRETRFTSRPTTKAAPNMEHIVNGTEPFRFSNMSPAAFRAGTGNLFVAWASDRVDAANAPNWLPKAKLEGDSALQPLWRIYISALVFDNTSVPSDTQSPIGDFNGWAQASPNRWFRQGAGTAFPTASPATLFTLNIGDTILANSVKFGAPAFSTSGAFDQLDFPSGAGRTGSQNRLMAFLGSAIVSDAANNRREVEQIMIADLNFAVDGAVSENSPVVAMPYDLLSSKSKPSMIQRGGVATVFYTTNSAGFGRVNYSTFSGVTWTTPGSLLMGNAFESVGAPSAVLRRWQNSNVPVIDVSFTARLRGRAFTEAFLTRMQSDPTGHPLGDTPQIAFGPRIDEMELDTATGLYWAPGSVWRLSRNDLVIPDPLAPFDPSAEFIDVFRLNASEPGGFESIVDKTTREFDRETGLLTYSTDLGGRIYVDSRTGSVRFSGALVPRSMRLYVRYAPNYMRVSGGPGANYRSVSMVFDDRFIGIYDDPANPVRSLLGDISYWGNEFSARPNTTDLLRWDRRVLTFTRTSGDGTQATRPFMSTMRLGINLPTAVALNSDGSLFSFQVQWIDSAGLPGSERFFQVDPATGRVFFMGGMEDRRIRIVYNGVNENGAGVGSITFEGRVAPTFEMLEEAVPIEQAGNESGLTLALDPLSAPFNRLDFRRPSLYWMFWTSTRTGSPDVFFQTVAPRFTPRPPTP